MPLIVKELIVRATVQDSVQENKSISSKKKQRIEDERDSLIQDAVEQVLEILDRRNER